jgi:hypothetical protein
VVTEIEPFECPELTPPDLFLWGWMKGEVYKGKVDTPDGLLARILDAAARINELDQLRRTTRDLGTRVANCTEVEVLNTNKSLISVLQNFPLNVTLKLISN